MDTMFFPPRYKKALADRRKNITIRYGNEFGKYKKGKIYSAKSYSGNDMGARLRVLGVFKMKAKDLKEFGVRTGTINKLKKEHKGFVELIRFEIV